MAFRLLLTGVLALSLGVAAVPYELTGRAECNHDNLLRCLIDERYSSQATAYCSQLIPSTTTVATVTATSYATFVTTIVALTKTYTVTSTTSVTLGSNSKPTPSSTSIVASSNSQSAVTVRATIAPRTATVAPPSCVTNGASYPASRITSACSCISVPASTASVTYTASTKTVTFSSTKLAVASTTTTTYVTVTVTPTSTRTSLVSSNRGTSTTTTTSAPATAATTSTYASLVYSNSSTSLTTTTSAPVTVIPTYTTTTTSDTPSPTPSDTCYGFTDNSCSGQYLISCDTAVDRANAEVPTATTAAECEAYCDATVGCVEWEFLDRNNGDIQCYWSDATVTAEATERSEPGIILAKVDASCNSIASTTTTTATATTTSATLSATATSPCYGFTDDSCSGRYRISCDTAVDVANAEVPTATTVVECEAYCDATVGCVEWEFLDRNNGDIQCYWSDARVEALGTERSEAGIILAKVDTSCEPQL